MYYYKPIVVVDSLRYLFPEKQPAFHRDSTCERLTSNFENIEVPEPIREKGSEEVQKFRDWFLSSNFDLNNRKEYIFKLQLKFPYVGEINPSSINYRNSGSELKKDYSLEELEHEIDDLLDKADKYFNDNPNIRDLIYKFQKWTFLGYVKGALRNNNSGLQDEQLKEFLRSHDQTFKAPVKERLIEYYKIKFNPDLTFEGQLLTKLGFRPCKGCL